VTAPLLVPDLALERWPSMDRYAAELAQRIPGLQVPREAAALRGPRFVSRYLRYPRALGRYRPAVVHIADHSYAHCLRAFPGTPSVVTIHDLYPVHVLASGARGWRAAARAAALRYVLDWLRRATHWIADSRFTADEATTLLGLPPERIAVVPLGVAPAFFANPEADAVERCRSRWRAALGGRPSPDAVFLLHVGSCVARKNVEGAIGALGVLRRQGIDACLVQVGGRFGPAHRAAAEAAAVATQIHQEPQVDEAGLLAAYAAADVLVMPSHYEGFGLPVLEAAAAGLPVVSSGAGALAEVGGDAVLVAPPADASAFAAAVARVVTDPAVRQALVERGRAHARGFSWETTARGVERVYDLLAGDAPASAAP